jgi:hypothetical protein
MLTSQINDLKSRLLVAEGVRIFRLGGAIKSWSFPGVRFFDAKEFVSLDLCSKHVDSTLDESRPLLLDFLLLIEKMHFRKLEELVVEYSIIGPEEAFVLSRLILKGEKLSNFRLKDVTIGNEDLETVTKAVVLSNSLHSFSFCYCESSSAPGLFPTNADSLFAEIACKSKSISRIVWEVDQRQQSPSCMFDSYSSSIITSLDLSFSFISDIEGLCKTISTNRSLISLELAGLRFDDLNGAESILNAIETSSIETLDFSIIPMRDSDVRMFKEMLTTTVSLTDLTFGPEDKETPVGPLLIDAVFKSLPKTNLTSVYLLGCGCQVAPEHVTTALQLEHVESITFGDSILSKECSERFMNLVDRTALKVLRFSYSTWEDESKLAKGIQMMNFSCSLTSLTIGKVSGVTASLVLRALKDNSNLIQFELQNYDFESTFGQEVFCSLIDLLKANRVLQKLIAGSYQQEAFDFCLLELQETLHNNSTIMMLSIQPNSFSKESIERNKIEFLTAKKLSLLLAFKSYSSMELDKYVFELILTMTI